jgi:hypothetical protein
LGFGTQVGVGVEDDDLDSKGDTMRASLLAVRYNSVEASEVLWNSGTAMLLLRRMFLLPM